MRSLLSLMFLGSSLVVTACTNHGDPAGGDTAEGAVDSADSASAEGNVMMAAIDGTDTSALAAVTGDAIAIRIAANITARYQPAGCATVTQAGAAIKVVYNDCTGPRGLVHVTGELDLAVAVSTQGTITVHATSSDLKVNGADLEVDATGAYAVSGTAHSLAVTTSGTGSGPRGLAVDHEGSYTVSWDTASQCHSIAGSWSTDIGARTRSNDVNLSRCAGGCPTGTVTHRFLGGKSITVTFDGTATAAWTASTGASGTVALGCQ